MARRPPVDGLVKHQIHGTVYGKEWVTTIWTWEDGATSADQTRIDDERAALDYWLGHSWLTQAGAQAFATRIKSWDFSTGPPTKFDNLILLPSANYQGTGGNCTLGMVTAAMSLRTQPVGSPIKGRNGRVYHPGMRSSQVAAGSNNLQDVASLIAVYETLRQYLNGDAGGFTVHGVWSVFCLELHHAANVAVLPVDHILCNGRVDVQRRRMPREGSFAPGA